MKNNTLEYLNAPDGHRIPIRSWLTPAPRGILLILHGMSEHSGCYDDVAPLLNQRGYHVVAFDQRSHGLAVLPQYLGCVNEIHNWENMCTDVDLMVTWVRAQHPGLPLLLLGHAMGSFIGLDYVERCSETVDGFLLEGTHYEPPWYTWAAHLAVNFEVNRQGINGRSALLHAMTFGRFARSVPQRRSDSDWISRDPDYVQRYLADPLCGVTCSNGFWRDLLEGLSRSQRLSQLKKIRADLPIFSFAGNNDPVGKGGVAVATLDDRFEEAGLFDVSLKIYDGARHDLLHELNQAEVIADVVTWCDRVVQRCALIQQRAPARHPTREAAVTERPWPNGSLQPARD